MDAKDIETKGDELFTVSDFPLVVSKRAYAASAVGEGGNDESDGEATEQAGDPH